MKSIFSSKKPKNFARKIENFVCDNCGYHVVGDGYTNHCPKCLFSKHVDINPGDRANVCKGLMSPVSIEQKQGNYTIVHKCKRCNAIKRNKVSKNDDFNLIIAISSGNLA